MLKREDYKAIKHMDKRMLEQYLLDLYRKGYSDGVQAAAREWEKQQESSGGNPS